MDYSALSNEELLALSKGDYSGLSDAALMGLSKSGAPAEVSQERSDVSFGDRAKIKNFGGDTPTTIKYLKEKYPGVEAMEQDGQIFTKSPSDAKWKALDPSGFDMEDITDVGYDVASGVGSGVATVAGGLGGGAASGGMGAIPAAMAAGAGSSTALELLRQTIGAELGVGSKEADLGQMALSGGLGALAPVAFGTGASAKQVAKAAAGSDAVKSILEKAGIGLLPGQAVSGANREMAKSLLGETQRSLITKNLGKMIQMPTGIGADTINRAMGQIPESFKKIFNRSGKDMTGLEASDMIEKTGVETVLAPAVKDARQSLRDVSNGLKERYVAAMEESGATFDLSKYAQPFQDHIDEIIGNDNLPVELKNDAKKVQKIMTRYFTKRDKVQYIDENGAVKEKIIVSAITDASPETAMAVKQRLKDLADTFASREGKQASDKTIMNLATEAYASLDNDLGAALSHADEALGQSGKLSQEYRDYSDIQRTLRPLFENPNRAYNVFRGLDAPSRRILKETIAKTDQRYGTEIGKVAELLDVHSMFAKPNLDAISSGSTTSTTRSNSAQQIGQAAGRTLGQFFGGAKAGAAGGALGAAGTSKLISPAAVKQLLKAATGTRRAGEKLGIDKLIEMIGRVPARTAAPAATWNMISGGGDEQ